MKTPFLFGIHCHQPAENFYHVVDWAVDASYAPFLEVALQEEHFKFAVHYSGWLLEYIRTHHTNVFNNLKKLADRNQVEFFTGGFYEPVLSAIPSDDRRGQVKMLSDYIKNHFGQEPDGLWLTERVWDPTIIADINAVGVRNIIVDDYHLIAAGFSQESITGYFKTEQDGCPINLFPIDRMLRYLTPFRPEEEVINYIKSASQKDIKLITCFDDGEKFGVWPSTNEWVYKNGWLKRFLEAVKDEESIEFVHYKEAAATIKPSGTAYLPITSYVEMGEWSLFADRLSRFEEMKGFLESTQYKNDVEQFLKGSIWKNFLVKYPESNRLHKRTLDLSLRGRKYKDDDKFVDALYRSQCNDSLWHGIFGGLYLPNLRDNAWKPLIEAEKIYEELAGIKLPTIDMYDMDFDGYEEVYTRNKSFNAMFTTRDCGQLTALELKDEEFNLLNVISRKKEGYHAKYSANKDNGEGEDVESTSIHDQSYAISEEMQGLIHYDWYNKNCFIDHFTHNTDLEAFEKCNFRELGDFVNQPAQGEVNENKVIFTRNGGLYADNGKIDVVLKKTYTTIDEGIDFEINAESKSDYSCRYVLENNFHFADWCKVAINGVSLTERGSLKGQTFQLKDYFMDKEITLSFDKDVELSWYVIYTVSQSESGLDLTAQGVTFLADTDFNNKVSLKGTLKIK